MDRLVNKEEFEIIKFNLEELDSIVDRVKNIIDIDEIKSEIIDIYDLTDFIRKELNIQLTYKRFGD